jgi:lipopolysaccharide exporter
MDLSKSYNRVKALFDNLLLSEGLRAKAIWGGAWLGGGSVAEQAFRFSRNIVLARLLAPGAFGTMAIVMSSASLVETLTDVGAKGAIIQNPRGGEDAYLNASWWIGMGRAVFTYILIFILAPWISGFYGHAELSGLLRVALLSALFNGAMSPRSILQQKEMKFARWAGFMNGGAICGVILTVVLSFYVRDVWALAIGYASENAFRCLLSYILCPGLPTLRWDWAPARELLTFSRGVVGLGFLNLIIARADVFVLARLYSSTDLGLYTMGVSLIITPMTFLLGVVGQILLPGLARVQEETDRLNRILLEVTSWLMLLGMPAAVSICLCAPSLLKVIYGSRYGAAAGPLSLATAVVFLTVINAPITCVLFARGRPALHRVAIAVSAVTILAAIYPACRSLGTMGGQVAGLLAVVAGYVFQLTRMRRLTGFNLRAYGKVSIAPALASLGILGVVSAIRRFGPAKTTKADIILCSGAWLIAYALCAPATMRILGRREEFRTARTPEPVASA